MEASFMGDIITSPTFISTLALFTVFAPETPVLLNIGPDSQNIIEIAILVCGATLLLGLSFQLTARHRMYVRGSRWPPSPEHQPSCNNTRNYARRRPPRAPRP